MSGTNGVTKVVVISSMILLILVIACDLENEEPIPLGSISGRVVLSDGSVTEGIIVSLEKREEGETRRVARALAGGDQGDGTRALADQTTTDEQGSYRFTDVMEGEYNIYASLPDLAHANVTSISIEETEPFMVPDMQLSLVGSISGTVVLDGSETGNGGVFVYLSGTSFTAITDDDGKFKISGVPSGVPFQIKILCDGTVFDWRETTVPSGSDIGIGIKNINAIEDSENHSIIWKGSFSTPPDNPEPYWAYHDSSDGSSYIYNGSSWDLLAQAGSDGADGISIIWQGELPAAPNDPKENWAYYNSSEGKSYIYDGSEWNVLVQDGIDGEDGAEGVSIVWLGEYNNVPSTASVNEAYHNTSDGNSYIYNGSSWDLLAQVGSDGPEGATPVFAIFHGNGATSGYLPQAIIGYEGDEYTIPENYRELAKTGYTFLGWNTEPTGDGEDYVTGEKKSFGTSQIELYAQWEPNTYQVVLDGNGGTLSDPSTMEVTFDSPYGPLPTPTRIGYDFAGWRLAEPIDALSIVKNAEDHTLVAQWEPCTDTQYTVERYLQDIASSTYSLFDSEKLTGTTGTTVSAETKVYPGFTEATEHEGSIAEGIIVADGTLTLKIHYTRNSYTVTFDANGGTGSMGHITLETGEKMLLPENAYTKEGYRFIGWSSTGTGSIEYEDGDEFTMGVSDTTLYANWFENNIIEGRVGTFAPITGATVEIFSPDGDYLGSTTTADDGTYRFETATDYEFCKATATGGTLLGRTFLDELKVEGPVHNSNLTPFSTLVCNLADQLGTSCDEAGQQLAVWLGLPEKEDPFVRILQGEDVPDVDVDALTYAIRSTDGGVSGWIDRVISAFESEIEPNAMWVDSPQMDAQTIWNNALDRDRGNTVRIAMEITVTKPSSPTKVYKALYYWQGTDWLNQDMYILFTSPVDVRNTGYLDNMRSGENQVYLYLSTFKKTRKIIDADYADPFGYDAFSLEGTGLFTFEDVQFPSHGTYTAKYALETEYAGLDAYMIRLEKDDEYTAYDSTDVIILKDSHLIVDRKMYTKESPLVMEKHVHASGLESIDGILTPRTLQMDNPHTDCSTTVEFDLIEYNEEIDPSTFTTRNLEK